MSCVGCVDAGSIPTRAPDNTSIAGVELRCDSDLGCGVAGLDDGVASTRGERVSNGAAEASKEATGALPEAKGRSPRSPGWSESAFVVVEISPACGALSDGEDVLCSGPGVPAVPFGDTLMCCIEDGRVVHGDVRGVDVAGVEGGLSLVTDEDSCVVSLKGLVDVEDAAAVSWEDRV